MPPTHFSTFFKNVFYTWNLKKIEKAQSLIVRLRFMVAVNRAETREGGRLPRRQIFGGGTSGIFSNLILYTRFYFLTYDTNVISYYFIAPLPCSLTEYYVKIIIVFYLAHFDKQDRGHLNPQGINMDMRGWATGWRLAGDCRVECRR